MNKDQDGKSTYRLEPAIWDEWIDRKLWFVSDGVFLLLELEPIPDFNDPNQIYLLGSHERSFRYIYARVKDEIKLLLLQTTPPEIENQTRSRLDKSIKPKEFLAWAQKEEINIPEPLKALIPDPIRDPQSDKDNEKECKEWLEELMAGDSSKTQAKVNYQQEAKSKFNVGTKAFLRAWDDAISSSKNTKWSKPGRIKSKPVTNA